MMTLASVSTRWHAPYTTETISDTRLNVTTVLRHSPDDLPLRPDIDDLADGWIRTELANVSNNKYKKLKYVFTDNYLYAVIYRNKE